jgi:Fe-S-cluster containining protein
LKFKEMTGGSSTYVCNRCGACCRNFAYVRLSHNDIETLESFTGLAAEEFTDIIDESGEKRFLKFKDNGDCIFLDRIFGAYWCSVYEARSVTCRGYPSTDIQREACRVNSAR